jgi:hypothetical protein
MSKSYLPAREPELVVWLNNFMARCRDKCEFWHIISEDFAELELKAARFLEAHAVSSNMDTRTRGSVARKNLAMKELVTEVRRFVRSLQANPRVTDGDRRDLRICVPKSRQCSVCDQTGEGAVSNEPAA